MPEVELSIFGRIKNGLLFIQTEVEKNLEEVMGVMF